MKKIVCFVICALLFTSTAFAFEGVSTTNFSLFEEEENVNPIVAPTLAENQLDVPVKSAILLEMFSGKVLYSKNEDQQMPPASVTKIMTLLLVMESLQQGKFTLDDMVTPSEHACSMGGSQIWLKPDESMSVKDLLKACAIASANDAAVALGELVAGSEEAFVALMNQRASELGMSNTHFVNATGLDAEGHLTTAADIGKMSRYLLINFPEIQNYSTVWMDSLRGGATQLVNTNKLVRFYSGCIGLKTGTTGNAGYCVSAAARRDNMSLVAVVMGGETGDLRFSAARTLLDTGFASWEIADVPMPEDAPKTMVVAAGNSPFVELSYEGGGSILVQKGTGANLHAVVELCEGVAAPVQKGQTVGYVKILNGEELVEKYPVVTANAVEQLGFGTALKLLAKFTVKMS